MKKSINTLLKHISSSKVNRSANPAVVRASTILFDSMQELASHEKKIAQGIIKPKSKPIEKIKNELRFAREKISGAQIARDFSVTHKKKPNSNEQQF